MHGVGEAMWMALATAAAGNFLLQMLFGRLKLPFTIGVAAVAPICSLLNMPFEAWWLAAFFFLFAIAGSGAGLLFAVAAKATWRASVRAFVSPKGT